MRPRRLFRQMAGAALCRQASLIPLVVEIHEHPQPDECIPDPCFDGAEWHVETACDLALREAVEVGERDGDPLFVGEVG